MVCEAVGSPNGSGSMIGGPERCRLALLGDLGEQPPILQALAGEIRVVAAVARWTLVPSGSLPSVSTTASRVGARSGESWRLAGAVTAPKGMPKASTATERFHNVAYTSNRLERTLAPSKYTTSGAAEDRLCMSGGDRRQGAGAIWRVICYSSRSSAERSSVRAFERITSAASSRESPPMSVSHTKASMPSVAPIP
jgi:hypothetical protein